MILHPHFQNISSDEAVEVIDRYVDPLVVLLKVMLNYRKFKKGTKAEVDELLRIEKAENPMRIVYCFGISHEHPTTCILTYIRSSFTNMLRHVDDPQKSAPSIRSIAAMVQMGSAATGGQAGGWDGSSDSGNGWGGQSSDQDQTFTPGSRAGSGDFRNGGSQDGHLSGIPRPYGGRGRGRGRRDGRSSDKQDFDSGIQSDGGGTGGWGGNGGAGDGTAGGWGGSGGNRGGGSSGGWGGSGSNSSGGGGSGGGWGGSGGSGGGNGGAWAGTISLWLMPVIFSLIVCIFHLQMFLQTQSNMTIAYSAAFSLAINVFLFWLLTAKYKN